MILRKILGPQEFVSLCFVEVGELDDEFEGENERVEHFGQTGLGRLVRFRQRS